MVKSEFNEKYLHEVLSAFDRHGWKVETETPPLPMSKGEYPPDAVIRAPASSIPFIFELSDIEVGQDEFEVWMTHLASTSPDPVLGLNLSLNDIRFLDKGTIWSLTRVSNKLLIECHIASLEEALLEALPDLGWSREVVTESEPKGLRNRSRTIGQNPTGKDDQAEAQIGPKPERKPKPAPPPAGTYVDTNRRLSDSIATEPLFGFPDYADAIVDLVEEVAAEAEKKESSHTGRCLLTLGLMGAWGSGKSTLMHAIDRRLSSGTNGETYISVWLNPWKWDGEESLPRYIRKAVLRAAGEKFPQIPSDTSMAGWMLDFAAFRNVALGVSGLVLFATFMWHALRPVFEGRGGIYGTIWNGLTTSAAKLNQASALPWWGDAVVFALILAAVIWALIWSVPRLVSKAMSKVEKISPLLGGRMIRLVLWWKKGILDAATELEDTYAYLHHLSEDLKDQSRSGASRVKVNPDRSVRFAFFIDDLDRCSPERVVKLLESVHGLTAAGSVSFLACDEDFLVAAINAQYESVVRHHPAGSQFGRSYLDKIIQVPFHLPALTKEDLKELHALLGRPSADAAAREPVDGAPGAGDSGRGSDGNARPQQGASGATKEAPATRTGGEEKKVKLMEVTLTSIIGELLEPHIEDLGLKARELKSLHNTLGLNLRTMRFEPGAGSDVQAKRLAAFILADRLDRDWLDAYTLEEVDLLKERASGVITNDLTLQNRLKDWLGKPAELHALYRRFGRLPRRVLEKFPEPVR